MQPHNLLNIGDFNGRRDPDNSIGNDAGAYICRIARTQRSLEQSPAFMRFGILALGLRAGSFGARGQGL